MPTFLVTGGLGFIGSHTVVELLRAGHKVIIVDNLSNSSIETLDRIALLFESVDIKQRLKFFNIDLRKGAELIEIFRSHEIYAVIHFAAYKAVSESINVPLKYYNNNLISTITLLNVMKEVGCRRLIFSSSATVYGSGEFPVTEWSPTGKGITNPYGQTKHMIEQILQDLAASDIRWSIVILRYFNPCGAHPSGLLGEDYSGVVNNLFPILLRVATGKQDVLQIYGDDYNTYDGTCIRDFIHVCDVADAHVVATEALRLGGIDTFNVGTGRGTSVLELINTFETVTGVPINYSICERRPGDLDLIYASVEKIRTRLGWSARRSLKDICADGYLWAQAFSSTPPPTGTSAQ